ncbi:MULTISPECIES: hypothetical protein [unclassified Ensifer]|uniref:hypothetical protein n=1 Tax=unclassified Ensifer TaxID=2633371 RepID=UPI000813429A|nr:MULTISPECIES: hypothetical protein [unclassified Ensifer]OCP21936.1 hypothetical protein BC361_25545 [Ensifer sp. LC54]OCP23284.1 hypothetical protein BC363_25220 [Ensifer sp. LC384]
MTSRNELYKYLAKSLIKNGALNKGEVGLSSNGSMFIRIADQVFKVEVEEITQIAQHPNAEVEAKRFMSTLPHPVTE